MSLPPMAQVGLTAAAIALDRAAESARPDGIVSDPWARRLVDAALVTAPESRLRSRLAAGATLGDLVAGLAGYVPLRTRWIDDGLVAAVAAGTRQVVILGTGLDTRALRLSWPRPVTVYGLDQPAVVAVTTQALEGAVGGPDVDWVTVAVDLADARWPDALTGAGFAADVPTVWVAEGLTMYLTAAQVDALVAGVHGLSAPGSSLFADLAHPSVHDGRIFTEGGQSMEGTASLLYGFVTDPVAWYAARGWRAQVVDPVALADRYARPVPPALDQSPPGGPAFWFTEAHVATTAE